MENNEFGGQRMGMEAQMAQLLEALKKFADGYPKLVRDKIPESIQRSAGRLPETRKLAVGSDEAQYYALKKVVEELVEFLEARTDQEKREEGGDLLLSAMTLLLAKKLDLDFVVRTQDSKEDQKGGFEKLILLLEAPNFQA